MPVHPRRPTLSTKRPARPTRASSTSSKAPASKATGRKASASKASASKASASKTPAGKAAARKALAGKLAAKSAAKKAAAKPAAKKVAKPRIKSTASAQSRKLLEFIIKSLDADKAEDIVSMDLSGRTPMADFMVVASGRSSRHVASIAEHLTALLKQDGLKCRVEGLQQGDWVLVDAVDVIVHIFQPEVRTFYSLEEMWGGAEPLAAAS